MLCETKLVPYTRTLEGAPDKWAPGQAVLCGNPDVPVSNGSSRSHLPPGEEMEKQPPALCWWMSPVTATMQHMQIGALAVKSTVVLDSSESCHKDLQGRVSKKINGCYPPCPSACSGLYERVYIISPSFLLLFCSIRDFPKDSPSKLCWKHLPCSLERAQLEAARSPSTSAEMWIKKCCSTARYESSCLLNSHL